ncbi:MAG TPA: MAPEG family protein [Tahibacter sp.]|nr:MAPEG family protein [Tahibacter sp.]
MTIAYWCVLAAAIVPLLFTAIAKFGDGGKGFTNRKPRLFQQALEGYRARAHWAHLNSLEAFPPFAAAVIIAQLAHGDQSRIDLLAIAFVVLRLVYGALYIADKASARSVVWALGFLCVVGLFVVAAQA